MTALTALVPAALLVYAAYALLVARWWVSGLAAPIVAVLLWTRHRRARFSAYVLLSVIVLRGALRGHWGAVAFAVVTLAALQLPVATRAWPRVASTSRGKCPRMTRP